MSEDPTGHDDIAELLRRAVTVHQEGRLDDAGALYAEILAADPDHVDALYYAGQAALQSGTPADARDLFARLAEADPKFAEGHYYLASAHLALSETEPAMSALDRALELKPDFAEALLELGNCLQALGRLDDAATSYRRAAALKPDLVGALSNLGIVLRKLGRVNEAISAYRQAIAAQPAFAEAHFNLALLLQEMRSLAEAETAYRRTLELRPGLAAAHINLGNLLRGQGRYEAAAAAYRAALDVRPGDAPTLASLAAALREMGKLDESARQFRQAIEWAPDFATAHAGLGATLWAAGDRDLAVAAFHDALAHSPGQLDALAGLTVACLDRDDYASAVAAYRHGLETAPSAELHCNLAETHLQFHEPAAALASCDDALAISPVHVGTLARKTVALAQLGERERLNRLHDFDALILRFPCAPPDGFPDMAAFNQALADHVIGHPTLAPDPPGHATRNGRHTGNLLLEPKGPVLFLEGLIRDAVGAYRGRCAPDIDHPVLGHAPERWSLYMWAIVLEAAGHQIPHVHPGGWLSGVYYVQVPNFVAASENEKAGWIEFGRPPERYRVDAPTAQSIRPQEGQMLLFPSYMYHRTIPFDDTGTRISIAFDIMPLARPTASNDGPAATAL